MEQDSTGKMTIGYILEDESAVVTVDVQTNAEDDVWISIGERNLRGFCGDVNKVIAPGEDRRLVTWQPGVHWQKADVTGGKLRVQVKAWATNNPPDVAVFSLSVPSNVMYYTSLEAMPFDPTNDLYKTEYLVMRRCHATGVKWNRGSSPNEVRARRTSAGEQPLHHEDPFVCVLSGDYYLGIFELTAYQRQLIAVAYEENAGRPVFANAVDGRMPCIGYSWEACRGKNADYDWPAKGHSVDESSLMGALRKITGYEFDLPTVSQWEFACRAGTSTGWFTGDVKSEALKAAWTSDNTDVLKEVGLLNPNAWGFYDMHGNASEWTLDYMTNFPVNHDCETGPASAPKDHPWHSNGIYRAIKGGGFKQSAAFARSGDISDWANPGKRSDYPAQISLRVCIPAIAHGR